MSKNTPERRKAKRRPVLDSFSLFVVVPSKGPHRLRVEDVSELGIGFDYDAPSDSPEFSISQGEALEVHFYLNQSLFLPLKAKVIRCEKRDQIALVGAEFTDKNSSGYSALAAFVTLLDRVAEGGQLAT